MSAPATGHPDAALWGRINRTLLAKSIGELAFEEAFPVTPIGQTDEGGIFELRLSNGIRYRFTGHQGIWGWIAVDPDSVRRLQADVETAADDCLQFYVDAQADLALDPATLSKYLRELLNTLMADTRIVTGNAGRPIADLADLPPDRLQLRLDGHPKAPANKGRLGWGLADYAAYAPEFEPMIRLEWIAASRDHCRLALDRDIDEETLIDQTMDRGERDRLAAACRAAGVDTRTHLLLPVHPWQWTNMVVSAFAGEIAAGRIVHLGAFGDRYLPQQSLRTLANADRPWAINVKLPLTILNTSCYRGIPGKYMAAGPRLSDWLSRTAETDPVLAGAGVIVLKEIGGAFYPHPIYEQIAGVPYQHLEMLGVIWRESVHARTRPRESGIMMGALLQRDDDGRPLASLLIERSGLGHAVWLNRLFHAVVVPLYHFLCRYGIGFIAHGQNITLVLEDDAPKRLALKDLQGDCDLVDRDFPETAELPEDVRGVLPRKPPHHIIHDIQTAHFVTVLRFLSESLRSHDGFPEIAFYRTLASVLRDYQNRNPDLHDRFALFDLFAPRMLRVCINRARFKIGYGDAAGRPLPILGSDIANPLHLAEMSETHRMKPVDHMRPVEIA